MSWAAIIACWAVSFLFSGIEAGLLSIDPVRLRHQVNERRRAALRLQRLVRRPERLLVTVLLVTNMANICALLLLTRNLIALCGPWGFLIALAIALPVYLFVLGVLPKSLFRRFPLRALAAIAGLLELASKILWPVLELGELLGRVLLPRRLAEPRLFAAREELKQIAVQTEREGGLTATERAMIHNVVDFHNVRARDVMVPIEKAVTVRPDIPVREAIETGANSGIDRLPVVSAEHRAVGLVNMLDLLLDGANHQPVRTRMRRILVVDERVPAYRILRRLRAARVSLAAVENAERQLIGITASEDLIKRLVQAA